MQTNFYVDAFNLYYGCLKGTPHRWLDLQALFGKVFPGNDINRIRYFTAIVESRPSDVHRPVHQQVYLRALQTIPNLSIHLGQYKTRAVQLPLATPPKTGGNGGLIWPHCGGLNWPHLRPTCSRLFGAHGARAGGGGRNGITYGDVRADQEGQGSGGLVN